MKRFIILVCAVSILIVGCNKSKDSKEAINSINVSNNKFEGEITVSCFDTMIYKEMLESSAKIFEEKNPGTKINIESFSAMPEIKTMDSGDGTSISIMESTDNFQSKNDYLNKINTALMSGEGPDLLAIDVVPYYKYAENGQLEDLSNFIESDPKYYKSLYAMNIIDNLKYKGKHYIFPLDYQFSYLFYDNSLLNEEAVNKLKSKNNFSYEELINIAKESFNEVNKDATNQTKMFGMTTFSEQTNNLFYEMFNENYTNYIDIENKKVNFNDGSFKKFLETIKSYGINNYVSSKLESDEITMDFFEKNNDERFFYKIKNNFDLLINSLKESGVNLQMVFGGLNSGNEDNDIALGMLSNSENKINFTYNTAFGINSNSKNKELAWSFLQFLASEEANNVSPMAPISLSINNDARNNNAKKAINGELFMRNDSGDDLKLNEKEEEIYKKYIEEIEKHTSKINNFVIHDVIIDELIKKEVADYFSNIKTSEEVSNNLQNKIQLYLNE